MSRIRDTAIVAALPYVLMLAALLMFWIFWSTLGPFLSGLSRREDMVSLMPRDAIGMPAGLLSACVALLTFPPLSVRFLARRTAGAETWLSPGPLLVMAAIASAIAVVLAVPIASVVSNAVATAHGYRECGPPRQWDAHPPKRWVLPGTPCP